eukprot:TRINITY_DN1045_c1_g2_i1.p1 TRINITY_DN1045_c1_g2~~TRINITY_DN1045_c1_g2_i1.p1  ORF type:complete len:1090 (-),score=83.66 TRINITY_DN1045_c1_g2_i1:10501-13770(-)
MTIFKYIIKSLWYFRKQHFAVLLGTIVSTAVLTGALIVGDSVKYSLHDLAALRLGRVQYAMPTGDRYVRAELATEMMNDLYVDFAALLQVEGLAIQPESQSRINHVQVYGIDKNISWLSLRDLPAIVNEEALVSDNLAARMKLKAGDELLVRVEKGSLVPANAPFVSDEDQTLALRVKVKAILEDEQLNRFSLKSNQVAPFNIFLSREYLAKEIEMEGKANLILSGESDKTPSEISECLKRHWQLEDASLQLRKVKGETELISDRVFIDESLSDAIFRLQGKKEPVLTYFVNGFSHKGNETPYSFVTAIENEDETARLQGKEMIISQWLANDLKVTKGDSIRLDYFVIGALRKLEEKSETFVVKEILPMNSDFMDKEMMPSFPGLSNAGSCNEWEAGVPVDFSKIRPKDEEYWKKYKGMPKAFISMEKALELWSNRYGEYTAIRFSDGQADVEEQLLNIIHPELLSLQFNDVRSEGQRAADNMVDFGDLFLSLSFFIILAAVLLTVLIYSLNLESRTKETGVLAGLGFTRSQIVKVRVLESLPTVLLGGILGVLGGILYNKCLLIAMNSVWQDVVRTNMLSVHLRYETLSMGFVMGVILAMICIWFVTRKKLKYTASSLIQDNVSTEKIGTRGRYSVLVAGISFLCVVVLIAYALFSSLEQNAELLLSAGGVFLLASCAWVYWYLQNLSEAGSTATPSIWQLAIKNAARNGKRSLATIVLLALGTFSVLITGANRKTFYETEDANSSGTGGYQIWLESTMPVLSDLNTAEGLEKLGFWEGDLDESVEFAQFRALEGDDASCLNLNQVKNPRILGFDADLFDQRGSFSFAKLHDKADSKHPWLALNQDFGEDVIPAVADQTVILWGLKKAISDTLYYKNESGKEIKLLLVGGLANSIFQGNILIADEQFQEHFPSVSGSKIVLIDSKLPQADKLIADFEDNMQDLGVIGSKTSERLAAFYSVENTYLNMFMFLGGLGVIIGTIGLGIVLMRNIIERRKELALLSAIGYEQGSLFQLLFFENLFLLIVGLICGSLAALIGVIPSLVSPAFQMPIGYILLLLGGILASGLIWIWIPARLIGKYNIIESLKNE